MATVEQLVRIRIDDDDLQQSAQQAEQELDQAVAKKRKVPKPDTSAVSREYERLGRELSQAGEIKIDPEVNEAGVRDLAGLVEDIGNQPIRLDADGNPAAAEVVRVQTALKAIDDAVVIISGDDDKLNAEIRQAIGLVETIERLDPVVKFTLQDQALKNAKGIVEDLNRDVEIDVDADTSAAQAEFAELLASFDFEGIGDSLTGEIKDALSSLGPLGTAAASAGTAVAGLFVAGFANGLERESARIDLQIQTGFTDAQLNRVGADAAEAYLDGFGGSLGDLKNIAATIEGELSGIDPTIDVQEAIRGFSILEEQIGVDLQKAISLTQRSINQGLVADTSEGLDLLIGTAQSFGNSFDEVFDVVTEFGPFFARLGVDGARAAKIVGQAWTEGLLPNIDRGAELFEEFVVEVSTGAGPAREAIADIGLDFKTVQDQLASGDGAAALTDVADALLKVEDDSERTALAVDIFRTAMEGASDPERVLELLSTADAAGEVGDAFENAASVIEDSNAAAVAEFTRQWELAFGDFSDGLILALSGDDSKLEQSGERIGTLIGQSVNTGLTEVLPTVYSDVIPAIVDGLIPEFEVGGIRLGDALASGITGPLEAVGNVLQGDFSGAFDAILPKQEQLAEVTNQSRDAIDSYAESARRFSEEGALETAAEQTDSLAASSDLAAEKLEDLQDEFDALTRQIESQFNFEGDRVFRDLIEATEELEAGFGDLTAVQVDFRGQIDQTTPAGRALAKQLETINGIQLDLIESTRLGSTTQADFAERSALLEESVRSAGEQAGLSVVAIDGLVDRYLELSGAPAAQLEIGIDAIALSEFRQQLNMLSETERLQLGFDIDNTAAVAAAAQAQQLFESLSTSIPIVYDVNDDGLLSAIESTIGFQGLVAKARLGFDFNNDGETSAQEAADAWELGNFFADLGFDVNFDGMTDADEALDAYEIKEALADLGYELDLTQMEEALAKGDAFEEEAWEGTASVDASLAVGTLAEARQQGINFSNDVFTGTATVIDRASPVLDQIARDRTATIFATTISRTVSRSGGNTALADGGIVGSNGVEYMRDGGIADGIARAVPGGYWTQFAGRNINLAENGGDELFLNSKSRIERQIDLIERFANGRLDKGLRDHYTNQNTSGPTVFHIEASTPVADPVLAGEEIARAIARRQERQQRHQTGRRWGPT